MQTVFLSLLGTLMGMASKLLTGPFFEWLVLWALEQGAKASKVTWDDELVAQVKESLAKKKTEAETEK